MIRIASGVVDQVVYFSAPPGITGHTVERSRNTTSFTAMTTPTVTELGSDGDYTLLLDEDMSVGAGNLTESVVFKIQADGMSTTRIYVELFDPNNYTVGTVTVNTDMRGTESALLAASVNLTGGNIDANIVKVAGGANITAAGTTAPDYAEP